MMESFTFVFVASPSFFYSCAALCGGDDPFRVTESKNLPKPT
jgi:hypothetical protein